MRFPSPIIASTYALYCVTMRGDPTRAEASIRSYMIAPPQPGDLIMEISTIWRRDRDAARLGRLVRCGREPIPDWEEERDGANPGEVVWHIQPDGGEEHRWVNAHFIRVLEEMFF